MQTQHEWESTIVRDVVLKTAAWNPAKEPRDTIRYVDVSAVSRERSAIEGATNYPANQAPGRARKVIHTNDTIFATIRPSLRRIAQVPEPFDNELASTAFCVLRPNPKKIDPDFLFHVVSSEPFVEAVVNLETGASYPAVRDRDILNQSIPLPPIAEQKNIASTLNLVRAALLHQSSSLAVAQELKRAAMRELFSHSDSSKPPVTLGNLCDLISIQVNPQDHNGLVYIGLEHVTPSMFRRSDGGTTSDVQSSKFYFNVGDILYGKLRPYLDKAIIADCDGLCTTELLVFRPKSGVPPEFLISIVHRPDFIDFAMSGVTGAQHPRTSWHHIKEFEIANYTAEEKIKIASILDAIDRKIDLHKRKKAVLEELFKSLLHKLMTGEISVSDLDLSVIQHSEAA